MFLPFVEAEWFNLGHLYGQWYKGGAVLAFEMPALAWRAPAGGVGGYFGFRIRAFPQIGAPLFIPQTEKNPLNTLISRNPHIHLMRMSAQLSARRSRPACPRPMASPLAFGTL